MIIYFGSKETEKIWNGERVKGLSIEIQEIGRRKLRMLSEIIAYYKATGRKKILATTTRRTKIKTKLVVT